jgi:vanillate monooxygenase ferredoxin subunit
MSNGNDTFVLQLAKSGKDLTVPANKTALQVLEEAGIAVPMSCGQGICGTCLTPVLAGVPEHWDSYLTEEEQAGNTCFTPCCSRSQTAILVIDL